MTKLIRIFKTMRSKLKRRLFFYKNRIHIAKGTFLAPGVNIGRHTRINNASYICDCDIGAFCAIGGRLIVRNTNHYTNYMNMQAWAQIHVVKSTVPVSGFSKGSVKIGNGVWIGDSVIILPDVEIGNGAVIGAGSVVTKSIPAYAIAVGNPAKVIKQRFCDEKIALIEGINWWDWPEHKIRLNRRLFEIDIEKISMDEMSHLFRNIIDG